MASEIVTVGTRVGLHARPAALIADAADKYEDLITLTLVDQDSEPADATSTLMIMALGAERRDRVQVESVNPRAVEEIAALVARDLDAK